jgi:hypothetical protein
VGRDLHDGAQQRLLAVANLLKLAERKLDAGDDVRDVLRLAGDELGDAQAELRDLARGLHPVALAERGLAGALESLTAGCTFGVRLDVTVDELPDDAELAAYFVVSESLTNASRYADADVVDVRVVASADELLVEILDDGAGGADPAAGPACAGSPTGSTPSGAVWTSRARRARGPASPRACRCRPPEPRARSPEQVTCAHPRAREPARHVRRTQAAPARRRRDPLLGAEEAGVGRG